ncbi:MAG: flagellar biosynthesis protein FlgB [Bacteroidota bacterium]
MDTPKLSVLRHAMQAYAMRTQALAGNIANLDTPDYQRETVRFEAELQARRRSTPGHRTPEDVQARYAREDAPALLEDEMMSLADTQMRTQLTTRALREHFDLLRTGITGRTG